MTRIEYNEILSSLTGWLELIKGSGLTELWAPSAKGGRRVDRDGAVSALGGARSVKVMFIGGFPTEEDCIADGLFAGPSGGQLRKIIDAMKIKQEDVRLVNVNESVKNNAVNLYSEIDLFRPIVIVTLGDDSTNIVLGQDKGVKELRGRFHLCRGILVMPTHHPSELLKNPDLKRETWEDMKMVMKEVK